MENTSLRIRKLTATDSASYDTFFTLLQKEFAEIPWLTKDIVKSGDSHILLKGDELVGGMTLFQHPPENPEITKEAETQLNGRPAIFASCFAVAEKYRKRGYGLLLAKKILEEKVFAEEKVAWGVFSKPALADFYEKRFECEIYPLPHDLRLIIFTGIR